MRVSVTVWVPVGVRLCMCAAVHVCRLWLRGPVMPPHLLKAVATAYSLPVPQILGSAWTTHLASQPLIPSSPPYHPLSGMIRAQNGAFSQITHSDVFPSNPELFPFAGSLLSLCSSVAPCGGPQATAPSGLFPTHPCPTVPWLHLSGRIETLLEPASLPTRAVESMRTAGRCAGWRPSMFQVPASAEASPC